MDLRELTVEDIKALHKRKASAPFDLHAPGEYLQASGWTLFETKSGQNGWTSPAGTSYTTAGAVYQQALNDAVRYLRSKGWRVCASASNRLAAGVWYAAVLELHEEGDATRVPGWVNCLRKQFQHEREALAKPDTPEEARAAGKMLPPPTPDGKASAPAAKKPAPRKRKRKSVKKPTTQVAQKKSATA